MKSLLIHFMGNQAQKLNICLNIHLFMSFKTLTIKEDVYKKLLSMKRENESFSDLFERLSEKSVASLKKLRGCIEFDERDKMIKDIYEKRGERRYC